ncbi:hypothetical protein FACS1894199_12880 [Bacteroidia bacterium]|nr:hypothetical protein FACS1894199_12880 [Bacteroidia bacterium]
MVVAQDAKHEFSIYGGGGVSALQYTPAQGSSQLGIGGGGGVGYSFFIAPQLGFNTGVEAAVFNASVSGATVTGSSKEVFDFTNPTRTEEAYFQSTYSDYKETQRALYLQIPLMAQFQTGAGNQFYAAAGVKVGLMFAGSYETTADHLVLSGYFPTTAQTFDDAIEMGYVTKEHPTASDNLDFGTNLALAAEAGIRWRGTVLPNTTIYTGVYMDYGLLNIAPPKTTSLVHRPTNDLNNFAYNSTLTATLPTGSSYVDKVNLLSVGVKLRVVLYSHRSDMSKKVKHTLQQECDYIVAPKKRNPSSTKRTGISLQ